MQIEKKDRSMERSRDKSNTSDVFQWTDLFEDYFGHVLDDETHSRWFGELSMEFSNLTNDQLCAAVRRGHRTYTKLSKPTLGDLFRWMREYRRDEKKKKCVLCSDTKMVFDGVTEMDKPCPDCGG